MAIGIWVLGDQLWAGQSAIAELRSGQSPHTDHSDRVTEPRKRAALSPAKADLALVGNASLC